MEEQMDEKENKNIPPEDKQLGDTPKEDKPEGDTPAESTAPNQAKTNSKSADNASKGNMQTGDRKPNNGQQYNASPNGQPNGQPNNNWQPNGGPQNNMPPNGRQPYNGQPNNKWQPNGQPNNWQPNGGPQNGRPQNNWQPNGGPQNGRPQNNWQPNGGSQNGRPQNNMPPNGNPYMRPKKKHSALLVILVILAIMLFLFSLFSTIGSVFYALNETDGGAGSGIDSTGPYIAQLSVNGTIQGDTDSLYDTNSYHHSWTIEKIDEITKDSNNRGLILFVNTPGGGVYESDELYYAISDYKEKTGRPVYAYMGAMAASGGYYISAPADKIFANRNCWTGSIGVTIGTLYDISGLLKKYGVKTVTITSGANKAMGSMTDKLTDEQKKIFQSLVDEAYDQFVDIVKEGRKMDEKKVRELADGRIYTAKQAKANGLIDGVGRYEAAVNDMKKTFELTDVPVKRIAYEKKATLLSQLLDAVSKGGSPGATGELDQLRALMDKNGKFTVTYLAQIDR